MDTDTPSFTLRLARVAADVEALLQRLLADEPMAGEIARPARLMAAMRHAVLNGGKRLRPFLVAESARLFGRADAGVLRAAAAFELLHCYSLVHDDLPSMDDDDLRRGQPTVHKAYDEATAILVGDGLQTLAFDLLADPATEPSASIRADLVLCLARASGIGGMVGGQMLDLAAEGRYGAVELGEAEIRRLQAMKTGALLRAAVEAGAVLGGASSGQRDDLNAYGRALGAAFQIADDILDREASAEAMGKRTGKDAEKGKATLVDRLGLDGARAEAARLVREAEQALSGFGPAADGLREAVRFTVERKA